MKPLQPLGETKPSLLQLPPNRMPTLKPSPSSERNKFALRVGPAHLLAELHFEAIQVQLLRFLVFVVPLAVEPMGVSLDRLRWKQWGRSNCQ